MTTQTTTHRSPHTRPRTILAVVMALQLVGGTAFAQLVPLPPLPSPPPVPSPPPLPLPLPTLPPDLSLAPPELPRIPSLPQVLPPNVPPTSGSRELPVTSATVDAKLLVISADSTEAVLGAIRQAADYAGIPYRLYVASKSPGGFTPSMLSDGDRHAYYQGIVMTTGSLAYFNGTAWTSAFNTSEWQTLWDYQAKYRVRTAIAYALPTADLGYGPATGVDATTQPISGHLTASGTAVFPYMNASSPFVITRAWVYLAAASGTGTNVLLNDNQGHALALVRTYPDQRQVLSLTFDGNFFLVHSLVLTHGLLNWVTGGLFVGERHVYATAQIDDIFIDNDMYGGGTYRLSGTDWTANVAWQALKRQRAQTAEFSLHMAFNGEGTTPGKYALDTVTPTAMLTAQEFPWINHTYTHENLDAVSYDVAYQEITRNNQTAQSKGLRNYDSRALVTPDISGLSNPAAMRAAYDAGVRFLVTDTSRPGHDTTPQAGIPNWVEPRILMIPRRPTNLYYNVSTPSEWTNEYNAIYRSYWGRDLSYTEILDKESDVLLQYMLRGEIDPWMFHQANLRAYDGAHTLLGDLLDRAIGKLARLVTLPVRSVDMADMGERVASRTNYNVAGVQCSFVPDRGTLTLTAARDVVVPVTGLCTDDAERYAGQCISRVELVAGETVTLDLDTGAPQTTAVPAPGARSARAEFVLRQNRPNPFKPSTQIGFDLTAPARVGLKVFDLAGRLVRTLLDAQMPAGAHVATWDGRDENGASVAGGVYFYELRTGSQAERRRMVLLR